MLTQQRHYYPRLQRRCQRANGDLNTIAGDDILNAAEAGAALTSPAAALRKRGRR